MTARGQDNGDFLLDLPLNKIDFILPLYVEKPFAAALIRIMEMIGTDAKGFSSHEKENFFSPISSCISVQEFSTII